MENCVIMDIMNEYSLEWGNDENGL